MHIVVGKKKPPLIHNKVIRAIMDLYANWNGKQKAKIC